MKTTYHFNFFVVLLFTSVFTISKHSSALAAANAEIDFGSDTCDRILKHSENVQISRRLLGGECILDIHPMNVSDMKYRDYFFSSEGLFMVFNSYGDGPISSTTGARMFYLFPRIFTNPAVAIDADKNVHIRLTSGHILSISAAHFRLKTLSGGQVNEANELNKKNKGGVEIKLSQGLLLDLGFTMGQAPNSSRIGKSNFISIEEKVCQVKNSEIFRYENDDAVFKFKDNDLKIFLQSRCPQISFEQ